jgi:DNA-binding transcriptional MerR regulator
MTMAKTRTADAGDQRYAPPPLSADGGESEGAQGELFTIGDLAREFGVTLRALRFYEDKGLLSPARDGLTRLYSARDREHLKLILKGKRLGFTLVEIADMIATHGDEKGPRLSMSAETVKEQIAHLERQRVEIDDALAELRKSYDGLSRQRPR